MGWEDPRLGAGMSVGSFYSDPAVRQRLAEFLGGERLSHATAVYITHSDGCAYVPSELHPPSDLEWFLERDLDIARSLADTRSLLVHLDIEYVNFDAPMEAYVDPWRTFELQEPVVRAIEVLLLGWGIKPLHLVTGQGHHFIWRVRRDSVIADRLSALAPDRAIVEGWERRLPEVFADVVGPDVQRAFSALSLVMEYLAHRVREESLPHAEVPVEITAVHVTPGPGGQREMVSIDISEYGDPLHTRMVRMPFTNYLKPWISGLARDFGVEGEIPRFRAIPLHEIDVRQAISLRQVERSVRELAQRACVRVPCQEEGTERLLDDYLESPLRRFHNRFYAARHDPAERWPETYARTPLETFPPCARHVILWPNDLLLKPSGMQLVARCLLAAGWHPRHIAGFIRSKFEDEAFDWGDRWREYDPATRADFYTRVFAGAVETGADSLGDLTCAATEAKGFCFREPDDRCSLDPIRATLEASRAEPLTHPRS